MKYIKIKDILEFKKKSKIKASEGLKIGKYNFYTSSREQNKFLDYYEYSNEALIIGTGGNANIHHSYGKFSVSTDCFVLENKDNKIGENTDFNSKNAKDNLNLKNKNDFNNEILEKNGINKIVIERRIFRDGDNLERIIDERGQYAKTAVKVLKTYPKKNATLVECELFTGRTHQIRVHLKSIGHTIVGDELYGNGLNKELGINRQFLHAYKVKFTHPATKKEVELEIPMFTDMKEFLEK